MTPPIRALPLLLLATAFMAIGLRVDAAGMAATGGSRFGCAHLDTNQSLPAVEGKEGYFYRVVADLRMQHQLSEHTAARMGELADALEATGTTLVYVPIPTKSLIMPQYLPDQAREYGFDYGVAELAYEDVVNRLRSHGVTTVDLLDAMKNRTNGKPAFFQADFHWTSSGARAAADEIAGAIAALPGFADVAHSSFDTRPIGQLPIISTMRRLLQANCTKALPLVQTDGYETVETAVSDGGTVDIFGNGSGGSVVLVGTSYSDLAASNFSGFLSQALSSPVKNFAISGGNQFGSITSYMTSETFLTNRPRFLIWENPVYNNLGKYGDTPLIELTAAARQSCRNIESGNISNAGDNALSVSLAGGEIPDNAVVYAYSGDDRSRHATLRFELKDGHMFESGIWRADRMVSTGRYYFPVRYFGGEASRKIQLEFDRMSFKDVKVSVCKAIGG
jgi:alginate biosynthesis protein AlgX